MLKCMTIPFYRSQNNFFIIFTFFTCKLKEFPILLYYSQNHLFIAFKMIREKLNNKMTSIASIYRTLEVFEKFLIIKKVHLSGNSVLYEISDAHHHHIICKDCDMIEEIEDCAIEKMIPYSKNFSVIFDHSLEFFGKCKKCV